MEEIKLNMENLSEEEREQLMKLIEKANAQKTKVWTMSTKVSTQILEIRY